MVDKEKEEYRKETIKPSKLVFNERLRDTAHARNVINTHSPNRQPGREKITLLISKLLG